MKASDYFKNTSNPDYSAYIAMSRYARYRYDLGRREMWNETVERWYQFWAERHKGDEVILKALDEAKEAVLNLDVMPSMRTLMTAGPALQRDNVAAFNCAFVAIDKPKRFDEALYILMCGTGVGFSVESKYVNKLPEVPEEFEDEGTVITVEDSKYGWAKGYKKLLSCLWKGELPAWDLRDVRPAGAPLKTFGGRASGPEPLHDLFRFTKEMFLNARGRKLKPIEAHDLMCKIAQVVVVGGVRRSALISLSDFSDYEIQNCKSGNWNDTHPHRALANNSAVYEDTPLFPQFIDEWNSLYKSYSGERGMFSRVASEAQVAKFGRREVGHKWGTNP